MTTQLDMNWSSVINRRAALLARDLEDREDRIICGWIAALESSRNGISPAKTATAIATAVATGREANRTSVPDIPCTFLAGMDEDGELEDGDEAMDRINADSLVMDMLGEVVRAGEVDESYELSHAEELALEMWSANMEEMLETAECVKIARLCGSPKTQDMYNKLHAKNVQDFNRVDEALKAFWAEKAKPPFEGDMENPSPMTALMFVPERGTEDDEADRLRRMRGEIGPVPYAEISDFELCGQQSDEETSLNESDEHDKRNTPTYMWLKWEENGEKACRPLTTWRNWDDEYDRLPIERLPQGSFKGIRKFWGKPELDDIFDRIWCETAPRNETEIAWLLRYFGKHIETRLDVPREEFYQWAVERIDLDWDFDSLSLQSVEWGENVVGGMDAGDGQLGDILFERAEGERDDTWDSPLPEPEWPDGSLDALVQTFKSTGSKPWETKFYHVEFTAAMAAGLGWKEASAAAMSAWRRAKQGNKAVHVYWREARANGDVEVAKGMANTIAMFTQTNKGKIVGLYPSGLHVNGKGSHVDKYDWNKAIVCAGYLHTDGKDRELIAAARKLGGEARIFADAYAGVVSYRKEHAR